MNFLTQSSEALYDVGRFDESMQDAQAALTLLNQGSWPDSSLNALKLTRAEALHNQAAGFRTTGQLSKSAESYNAALKLVPAASAKDMDPGFAHIYVLSQFGLGEVEFQSLALSSAATRFQAALDFANARGLDTDDVHWWRALAYEGLGLSQWDNNEAVKWFSKAADEVQWLKGKSKDRGNPQWKRLFADITYRWGYAADQLNQYDAAVKLFAESQADAEDLVTRDPDNRDWQLMLLQARRGIGQIHYDQGEVSEAQTLLGQVEKGAKELNDDSASLDSRCGPPLFH